METTVPTDVRVVETVSNYTETVKLAVIAGVATVIATELTLALNRKIASSLSMRKVRKENAKKVKDDPQMN